MAALRGVDRRAAKTLLAAGDYEPCTFHCQQAVEKLLKAIIVQQTGERPPHIHDLFTLCKKIADVEPTEEIKQFMNDIDAYYIGTRYPLEVVNPNTFDEPLAESAVKKTETVFRWFLTQINFEDT